MKYFGKYKNFSKDADYISNLFIENFVELDEFADKINEGFLGSIFNKIGKRALDWMVDVPKIKKAQMEANRLRLEAAKETNIYRQNVVDSLINKKGIDTVRLKTIMFKKISILLDDATRYENEAMRIAGNNSYLLKILRIYVLEGQQSVNDVLLNGAVEEEKFELESENKNIASQIEIDTYEINRKMQDSPNKDHLSEPSVDPKTSTIGDKFDKKLDDLGIKTKFQDNIHKQLNLFTRSVLRKAIEQQSGKKVRKSSNKEYAMIDEMIKLINNKGYSEEKAFREVTAKYNK